MIQSIELKDPIPHVYDIRVVRMRDGTFSAYLSAAGIAREPINSMGAQLLGTAADAKFIDLKRIRPSSP